MSDLIAKLDSHLEKGVMNVKLKNVILDFCNSYKNAIAQFPHPEQYLPLLEKLIVLVIEKLRSPYPFEIFHKSIRHPFDYYQFGLDFMRPFVDFPHSNMAGHDSIKAIQAQLKKGENVILLANHQIEPDPQIISLLLEKTEPKLASDMIFVAGHRVITDPMAVPFSLGRNLLCIYSKKHMLYPPEEKGKKVLHNQRTLKKLQELLHKGGSCIYVAPSGGRDRPNETGKVDVSPFDPQSIELFWLMAQQASKATHFYPLALKTYPIMPPPRQVEKELGEKRIIHVSPVFLEFGTEIEMENFPGSENLDKKTKRNKRAEYIWSKVLHLYQAFP